nr:unnamed protein product [Spirometra erinaceieuropaei]
MSSAEVLERTRILSLHVLLKQLQLRRTGQSLRMDDERLQKPPFYVDAATGASRQDQKSLYKNTLKSSLKRLQIISKTWKTSHSTDRPGEQQ